MVGRGCGHLGKQAAFRKSSFRPQCGVTGECRPSNAQHEDANAKILVPGCRLHPGLGSSLKMFSTHHPEEPDYDTCVRRQEWYLLHGSFCSSHRAGSPCGR